jgi:hypothetical protein
MAQNPMQNSQQSRPGQQHQPLQQAAQVPPPQPVRRRRTRIKGWILGVPLLLAVFFWLYRSVDVAVSWEDIMDRLGVRDRERYTRLAILGITICCLCAIARVLRRPGDQNEDE